MCKKCGTPITIENITRSSTCPDCGRDLHTCINCRFYSPGSHYDCHETIDELVKDKEKSNFCDFFKVNSSIGKSASPDLNSAYKGTSQDDKAAKARAAFDALFS
ncbi:hypothetical protein [uncultured Treponema sp.]|uniref:hypothetical protein n=1 Tax=Treponema sp. TaxID=166 RepID=UPI00298EB374|nr:hypothetical protein [uncultured Treponema sp.]